MDDNIKVRVVCDLFERAAHFLTEGLGPLWMERSVTRGGMKKNAKLKVYTYTIFKWASTKAENSLDVLTVTAFEKEWHDTWHQ